MAERKVVVGPPGATREIVVHADDADAPTWGSDARLAVVGTDVPRLDATAKATGAAKYTADVAPAHLAFARALRCPHAHARVVRLDLGPAQAVKGVLGAVRWGDAEATFSGAPVAAVCAETETALDDAIAAIRVEYEVLPHVVETDDALASGAPQVARSRPNRQEIKSPGTRGDPDAALAAAAIRVDAEYRTAVQTHVALEPHGSVASFGTDGTLTLWCSTQAVSPVAQQAQRIVGGTPVRVIAEHVGGGFGAKFGLDDCDRIAIDFAKRTGRPVRCMNDRREEHLLGGFRPDSVQRVSLGGTKDGRLTVLVADTVGTPGNGVGAAGTAIAALYEIPALRVVAASASTHTAVGRAFRAPGHPQGVFALESAVDEFAHAAGLDPLDVRRRNDPHPVRRLEWPIAAERSGWAKWRATPPGGGAGPVKRGVGCAGGVWHSAGGGSWRVEVSISRDGRVVVANGAQDIGTGTRTVLAVLVAEELGLAATDVEVRLGDSTLPPGPGSGGSTTASSLGPAAREAAVRAREVLADALAAAWGVPASDLAFLGGTVRARGGRSAPFRTACAALGPEGARVFGQRRPNHEGFERTVGGVQVAQVAVDVETGVVRVERVVAVHDAGRIVDTLTARSQVNGGVIQGVSYALFEEKRLDRATGDMVNPTHDTYRVLGAADCPEIDVTFLPFSNGVNNAGMMGLGEPATVPTAAAVANAVFHATGARVRRLPITPPRMLEALAAARSRGAR